MSIQSLDDFASFASTQEWFPGCFDGFLLRSIVVETARGNLESARAIGTKLATGRTRWSAPHFRSELDRVMQLCPLLEAEDRAGLVRLLREWEADSVRNLGLEDLWEQVPFPIELRH